jgi:hypothetical protein
MCSVLCFASASAQAPAPGADEGFLRGIAAASLSNREAFQMFTCTFALRSGEAETIQKALAGDLLNVTNGKGIWVVNKRRMRFGVSCDKEAVVKAFAEQKGQGTKGVVRVPFSSEEFLDNGSKQFRLSLIGLHANISNEQAPDPGVQLTPFDMGIMGANEVGHPSRLILGSLDKKYYCRADSPVAGTNTQVIHYSTHPDQYEYVFSFDPAKNFLPVQIRRERITPGPGAEFAVHTTRAEQFSGGKWFPMRSVLIWQHRSEKGPFSVREINVESLTADTPPPESDFVIDLPAGTNISDGGTTAGIRGVNLPAPERVGPDDLDRISKRWEARVSGADANHDTPTTGMPPSNTWTLLMVVNGVLAAVVIGLIVVRRRRRRMKAAASL